MILTLKNAELHFVEFVFFESWKTFAQFEFQNSNEFAEVKIDSGFYTSQDNPLLSKNPTR